VISGAVQNGLIWILPDPSQKIVRHVGDGAEPFDPAESLPQPFAAQPVAHLRVRLHGLDLDALRGEFAGEAASISASCMSTIDVSDRSSTVSLVAFRPHSFHYRVAHVISC
jgi:hypothetical protein